MTTGFATAPLLADGYDQALIIRSAQFWLANDTIAINGSVRFSRRLLLSLSPTVKYKMLEAVADFSLQVWLLANRLAAYALVNLIDDPAILAMAFC